MTTPPFKKSEPRVSALNVGKIQDGAKKNYFSLFPDEEMLNQSIPNAFIINRPMSGVGGDGYWFYPDKHTLYLAVFDCMGHGHLASMMTRIYTNTIKKVIIEDEITIPGQILSAIHDEVKQQFEEKEKKQLSTGADFGILRINKLIGEMEFAGAKMDLIEVENGVQNIIKADRKQVGELFDYEREYLTSVIELKNRGRLNYYLSSDGVKDLIGGPEDKKMGSKNVKELLEGIYSRPMREQKKTIMDYLDNWSGSNPPNDDVLMVGFSMSVSFKNNK